MTTLPDAARQRGLASAPPAHGTGRWHTRLVRSGYFFGAVLFHLIVLLMLATLVVFRPPPAPLDDTNFHGVKVPPPPPPAPAAPSGGASANAYEPAVDTAPPPCAPSVVCAPTACNFAVSPQKVNLPNLPASLSQPVGSALAGHDLPGATSGSGSPFGAAESNGAAELEGYLYDLKQTSDRQPTNMDPGGYHNTIRQFIADNWNPSVLRPYYKAEKALHATSIFIPIIDAADGPKAFGVQDEVQPRLYCVWYKVTASPAQDGTYHFVGTADDIMLVRVNHRTVLDGSDGTVSDEVRAKQTRFNMTDFDPTFGPNGDFWVGTPFHVSAHEPVDIEVLIGEEPGGKSDYFLYIQRDEDTYEKQSNGAPLLPIFQLDPNPIQPKGEPRSFPPFAKTPEPWEGASTAP
ncbi:MAG: hypothetical protein WDO13_08490 [Verrucomicrobiota bacterium]